jgi:HK97 family phage portal protein
MGLLGLFESRANLESPQIPLTATNIGLALGAMMPTDAGIPITETTAMRMSAVYRATSLVSGLGGALPINCYKAGTKDIKTNSLLANPHPDMTKLEFWRLSYVHRCLWGNFYAQKMRADSGRITWLNVIHPKNVTVLKAQPSELNPTGKIFKIVDDSGKSQPPMTPFEIFHLPGLGYDGIVGFSPVRLAAQAIGLSMGAEKYAGKLFGRGNLLSGLLQMDSKMSQKQANDLQREWSELFSGNDGAHRIAVLDAGAKFQPLTMPNDEAQLLESRDFQITEMARFWGIPPYLMYQTDKTTSWGSGLEQQARGFNQFDLHPSWLGPTEQRITKELLPAGIEAKYDMDVLLRGDSVARAQYYAVLREAGVLNADEIRFMEDMPPIPDGQGKTYIQPAIQAPMGSDPVLGGFQLGNDSG